MSIVFLPFPPSVNQLYRNVPKIGRVKTAKYNVWLGDARRHIAFSGGLALLPGRFQLTIAAAPPDKRKRDIDNICKPVLDLLVDVGAVEDDSLCEILTAYWDRDARHVKTGIMVDLEAYNGRDH